MLQQLSNAEPDPLALLLQGETGSALPEFDGSDLRVRALDSGLVVRVGSVQGTRLLVSLGDVSRARVRVLDFTGGLGLCEVTRCLDQAGWTGLTALTVDGNAVQARRASLLPGPGNIVWFFVDGDDTFFRIVESLPLLRRLRLCENRLGPGGARQLARLDKLEWLEVRGNQIGDEGASALGSLKRLVRLDVSSNGVGSEGVRCLAQIADLERLELSRNPIGLQGARTLADRLRLVDLRVARCGLGPASVAALARISSLEHLDLSDNPVGSRGVGSLVRAGGWKRLWLASCGLGDGEIRRLGELVGLERLELRGNTVSDVTLAYLVNTLKGCTITV